MKFDKRAVIADIAQSLEGQPLARLLSKWKQDRVRERPASQTEKLDDILLETVFENDQIEGVITDFRVIVAQAQAALTAAIAHEKGIYVVHQPIGSEGDAVTDSKR